VRITSVVTLWIFIGVSAVVLREVWVAALLVLIAGAVTLHLYSLPSSESVTLEGPR